MSSQILVGQTTATKRHVYFDLMVDATDLSTPEVGEAGGQPEISTNGGAFTSTGIGVLAHMGNGWYYAVLTEAAVATVGDKIAIHYDGANVAEVGGDQVHVVGQDPDVPISVTVTGGQLNKEAASYVRTIGTESAGGFSDTAIEDGVTHEHTSVGNAIDIYYQYNIGGGGVPTAAQFFGRLNSNNDSLAVQAYNWGIADWETIGPLPGQGSSINQPQLYAMLSRHVGTGANLGLVRIRFFAASGLTSATLVIDQLLVEYAINDTLAYPDGIHVDTVNGVAGTEVGFNGRTDRPCLTWADAITIAVAANIFEFRAANGSAIQLTGDSSNYTIKGTNWTLDLNGQAVATAHVVGAIDVIGTGTGSGAQFVACIIASAADLSMPPSRYVRCWNAGNFLCTAAGTYDFGDMRSAIPGSGAPTWDFGPGAVRMNLRAVSSGVDFRNMKAGDVASVEGFGQVIFNANCAGGTVNSRGHFDLTDNSGNITLVDGPRFESASLVDDIMDEPLTGATHNVPASLGRRIRTLPGPVTEGTAVGPGANGNQIVLESGASSVDGSYDPSMIIIPSGTGAGQVRLILQYDGASRTATVDRTWKILPDNTSEYLILGSIGREHVNEGLFQAATSNTATLNTLASSVDDAYCGQILFLRSGTGEDQVRYVTAYDGTTKIATVNRVWDTLPDTTSAYVMLPNVAFPCTTSGARTIAITVKAAGVVVPGIKISIYDATNTTLIGHDTDDDLDGIISFNLDDATYTVRISGLNFVPDNVTETLVVTADASVTYTGTRFVAPAAPAAGLCTVWGYARANGVLQDGAILSFVQTSNTETNILPTNLRSIVETGPTSTNPSWATGYFEIDLEQGSEVDVRSNFLNIKQSISVPAAESTKALKLLLV